MLATISREIARNGGRDRYRATRADERAWTLASRPKTAKLTADRKLREIVAEKLQDDWSPEQVSGWLKATNHGKPSGSVSWERSSQSAAFRSSGSGRSRLSDLLADAGRQA